MEDERKAVDSIDSAERERAIFNMMDDLPTFPLPTDEEWRFMVRHLRVAWQMFRERICDTGSTDQQTLLRLYASGLTRLFHQIPEARSEGLNQPLVLLVDAFADLADGTVPDLFRPVRKPMHRPKEQRINDRIKGMAARALSCLIAAGYDKRIAARFLVKVLRDLRVRGSTNLRPDTIINWRARCSDRSMSHEALQHYFTPFPGDDSLSPSELERVLASELREAVVIREPFSQ